MKTVSESTWSFQIIIFFILIFAAFLVLVLSYNKAYTVKNRTLSILEKYEGATVESLEIINGIMHNASYKTTGRCPLDWYGALDFEGTIEKVTDNKKYYYCLNEIKENKKIYYEIKVFYKFDLPVIGNVAIYSIDGETKPFIGADERLTN